MQEGVDEVTVTYNAPVAPRPGAEPQDDRGDSEDLPDLLPINDGVHPSIYRCSIYLSPTMMGPLLTSFLQGKLLCSKFERLALAAAVWGPPDSDEDADEEDLIQEFGQPMDTSSDSPAQRSMSEQAALEVSMPTHLKCSHLPGQLCLHAHPGACRPCRHAHRLCACLTSAAVVGVVAALYCNITGLRSQLSRLLTLSTSSRRC